MLDAQFRHLSSCFITFLLSFQAGGRIFVASCIQFMCRVRSAAFSLPRLGFPEGYVPKDRREATWNLHMFFPSQLFYAILYYFILFHDISYYVILFHIISYYSMLQYVQLFHAISCSFTLLRTQYVYIHPFMTMDGVIHVQTFVARWTPFIGRSVLRQCPQQGFFSQCQLLSNPSIFPEFSTVLHYVSLECDENHTFTRTFELFSIRSKCWNMLEYVGICWNMLESNCALHIC